MFLTTYNIITRNNEKYDVQRQTRKTDHHVKGMGDSMTQKKRRSV